VTTDGNDNDNDKKQRQKKMKRKINYSRVKIIFIFYSFRLRGSRKSYLWKRISELHKLMVDIQTAHAKLGSQDGNSREH
jgi:hypothetical protein